MSTTDAVPRDPSALHPTPHFGQQLREDERHLEGDIIRACIERGRRSQIRPDRYLLTETVGGVTYRLVVDTDTQEVVTGYPARIDEPAARASARWTDDQLADIRHFLAERRDRGPTVSDD